MSKETELLEKVAVSLKAIRANVELFKDTIDRIESLQSQNTRLVDALHKMESLCLNLDITPITAEGPHPFVMIMYGIIQQALKESGGSDVYDDR